MEENTDDKKIEGVPIRLRVPTRMPSVVAQHLIVQPNQDGVLLSFFEIIPPIVLPSSEEDRIKQIQEHGMIAECVSKVFVPNTIYKTFVDIMGSVLPDDEKELEENGKETSG